MLKRPAPDPASTVPKNWVPIPDDLVSEESDFHGKSSPGIDIFTTSAILPLWRIKPSVDPNRYPGNKATKSHYQRLAASYNPQKYWAIHNWNVQVIAAKGKEVQEQAAKTRAKQEAGEQRKPQVAQGEPSTQHEPRSPEPQAPKLKHADINPILPGVMDIEPVLPEAMDVDHIFLDPMDIDTTPLTSETAAFPSGDANPPRLSNPYEGLALAKQNSETIDAFLTRLPPSTTSISAGGPWIWVANPYPAPTNQGTGEGTGDIATFKQHGTRLLSTYLSHRAELEALNPGKPAGSITRMLRDYRLRLERDILDLAKQTGVTAGKWMLFPSPADVDRVWAVVARGTWEGRLGISAKVATAVDSGDGSPGDGGPDNRAEFDGSGRGSHGSDRSQQQRRLVCIYTYNFLDKTDVNRVLGAMSDLGLLDTAVTAAAATSTGSTPAPRPPIYYKCDAYTYLDISSGNEYNLKASMYNSRDMSVEMGAEKKGRGNVR